MTQSKNVPFMVMPVYIKFWGEFACFARPEFPTERVSYLVPTPSAVRGMLEAIYWKPQFHYRIREIRVLNPIEHYNETRNEVTNRATRSAKYEPFVIDARSSYRMQRHTLALRDVAYVIVAECIPNTYTSEELVKHTTILKDRADRGMCFSTPYFGSREWSANFALSDGTEKPINMTADLGEMAFDWNFVQDGMTWAKDFNNTVAVPFWFDAKIVNGVVKVPDELYEHCGGCRQDRKQPPLPAAV